MIKQILKKIILKILEFEARIILLKYKPKIIVVSGSVGKTGTKDLIYHIIQKHFYAYKSIKSYNSELGVPLTIIMGASGWSNPSIWIKNIIKGLDLIILKNHYPKLLVLEAGVDRPGDMRRLSRWIKPDIAVLTKFNDIPPHVEFFKDRDELYKEKWNLITAVKKEGYIIINGDDENIKPYLNEVVDKHIITFGFNEEADVKASNKHIKESEVSHKPIGITFKLDADGHSLPITICNTIGEGYIYSALAALSVAKALGINFVSASENLNNFIPPVGRMRILEGIKGSTIIDDSYNSSPDALYLALDALKETRAKGKKILVVGDMLELGAQTIEAHKKFGHYLDRTISELFLIGPRAKYIVEEKKGGLRPNQIHIFSNATSAIDKLIEKITDGDIILVKGSQGVRLEKIVEKIMAHPEDKKELLVRQERQWANK